MTIVSVEKMWSRNESTARLRDNFRKLDVSFRAAYQVVVTVDTNIIDVYSATDPTSGVAIPLKGEIYPGTDSIFAREVNPKQVSPLMYIVDATWEGEAGPGGPEDSPLNRPPIIDFDDIETDEDIDEDWNGYPIINANYEPIEGIKVGVPDMTMNITRNFATWNPYTQAPYRRATNSDTFFNWPAGTARIIKLRSKLVNEESFGYFEVSASLRFRYPFRTTAAKAWYSRVRHEGFYERLTPGGIIVRAVDGNKEPVSKKILLKADGTRETDPNNTYWQEIQKYGSLPFNALGLL